jgi:outer membrane lipoprotein-sorting protein/thiol-disulfide isomerase/thioredoxin
MKKILVVFALMLLTISAHTQEDKNATEARRIFDEMRAEYSRLETFSRGTVITNFNGKEVVDKGKFSFRQPNRYSEITNKPGVHWIRVSTGRTYYLYDATQSKTKYFAMPMPPEELGRVGIMQYNGGGLIMSQLLSGVEPFDASLRDVARSFSLGKPTKINGVMTDAVVVRFDNEDKSEVTYFIGQKDHLLHRIQSTSREGAKVRRYSETYFDVRGNPKIPIHTFAFIPPPSAHQAKLEEFFYEQNMVSKAVRVGGFPPPLKDVDLKGNAIDLKSYKGKVVLLDFWATWCGWCVDDLPYIKAAYAKFHDQDFEIISISADEKREVLEKFVREKNMTWPQIFAAEQKIAKSDKRYDVRSYPTTLLIGRDGKIVAFNPRRLLLEPAIEKALAAPVPE